MRRPRRNNPRTVTAVWRWLTLRQHPARRVPLDRFHTREWVVCVCGRDLGRVLPLERWSPADPYEVDCDGCGRGWKYDGEVMSAELTRASLRQITGRGDGAVRLPLVRS